MRVKSTSRRTTFHVCFTRTRGFSWCRDLDENAVRPARDVPAAYVSSCARFHLLWLTARRAYRLRPELHRHCGDTDTVHLFGSVPGSGATRRRRELDQRAPQRLHSGGRRCRSGATVGQRTFRKPRERLATRVPMSIERVTPQRNENGARFAARQITGGISAARAGEIARSAREAHRRTSDLAALECHSGQ